MKLNHFICPTCGHDFYCDATYATCDACQTFFYAAQSRTGTALPFTQSVGSPVIAATRHSFIANGYFDINGRWIQMSF